jgi:glutamate 5-kinase
MDSSPHRIVIKVGTGLLTETGGTGLDVRQFRRLTYEVADLVQRGVQCLIVTSGAVGAGLMALGLRERPKELASIQACAAIGQSRLMRLYGSLFGRRGLLVAQVLLTHFDLDSRTRYANAKNTLERLLASRRVVPIVNENDTVAVEELRFGDNDRLSAEVARLVRADLLILLTSANGLTRDGDPEGEAISEVTDVEGVAHLASAERGQFSVGGMASKLQAVKLAVDAGITAVIAHGRKPGILPRVAAGESVGTRFLPSVLGP